jgi:N-acetylglucosamine malate deacetylase 1
VSASLDILVIAAHPGDAEAACGGTLIRMAELGYRAGVLDLTPGDLRVEGSTEERLAEAQVAEKRLKLEWRDNQRMPDGRLENSLAARMTLAVRIRELKPRVVILPCPEGDDPDQAHCRELGVEACSLASLTKLEEYSEAHRPERILFASFFVETQPSFVVDVCSQFAARRAALESYASAGGEDRAERIEALARFHGSRIGVRYGEPFITRQTLPVGDIVKILGL